MDGLNAYKHNAVATQSPGRLIVLLYEGAVKNCRRAIAAIDADDFMEKGVRHNKAIDIISELSITLDMDVGGEIAQNLQALYDFMIRHLTQANANKDPQAIRDIINLLEELNEGWKAIAD